MPTGPPMEFEETPLLALEFGVVVDELVEFRFTKQVTFTVVPHVV
jgi:hypothetical protein